ncbi:MAG: ABC transporter ATP-binding protein [Alphaproteobacteria bacterium]
MAELKLENLTKTFGTARAVDDLSLDLPSGEFVTLLGPSGCGKTTTLRMVAGLEKPDSGTVRLGGTDVTALPPFRRNIGMVFQSHALFPHMTVAENAAFGLRMRKIDKAARRQRVREALDLVRLADYLERYPHQLSGGQQQRVALARALVVSPDILLLDEPFGALDRKLREALQEELRQLTRKIGITSLFVTHDQEEALILSDRICVMNAGRIDQIGSPETIFEQPETHFVADFMGVGNFISGTVSSSANGETLVDAAGCKVLSRMPTQWNTGTPVTAAIRAEKITLSTTRPSDGPNVMEGQLDSAIYQGATSSFRIRTASVPNGLTVRTHNESDAGDARLATGQSVWLTWSPDAVRLLPKD